MNKLNIVKLSIIEIGNFIVLFSILFILKISIFIIYILNALLTYYYSINLSTLKPNFLIASLFDTLNYSYL